MINASYEGICVEFERKKYTIGVPSFKLPACIKTIL